MLVFNKKTHTLWVWLDSSLWHLNRNTFGSSGELLHHIGPKHLMIERDYFKNQPKETGYLQEIQKRKVQILDTHYC